MKYVHTTSNTDSRKVAHEIAAEFSGGEVLGLTGDLGTGKTNFVQGVAEYFNVTEHVSSPTFTLIQEYIVPDSSSSIKSIIHIDCYRLKHPEELQEIGIEEYFRRDDVVVLIEWAQKVRAVLPDRTQWIEFSHGENENERSIKIV